MDDVTLWMMQYSMYLDLVHPKVLYCTSTPQDTAIFEEL